MNFFKKMIYLLTLFNFFFLILDAHVFSLLRHNLSHLLLSRLPADLLSTCLNWVQLGRVAHLHPLYDGTYAVLRLGPCAFTLQVGPREEISAMSRLKACTAVDATPGIPRRHFLGIGATATPAAAHPSGSAATKRVLCTVFNKSCSCCN
jgi:hypothetical protein